jgi:copper homeostasis protein CutC
MKTFLFEVCAESAEAARAAESGGADRIELCSQLPIGGVTPEIELTTATIRAVSIPVHVLIRPRGGDFAYTAEEFALVKKQMEQAKQAGAAGVAVGVLLPDGRVDVERTRELVSLGRPMSVTFHRAFDTAFDLSEALEAVIETGADCLLTSGGVDCAKARTGGGQAGDHGRRRPALEQPGRGGEADGRFLSARIDDAQARCRGRRRDLDCGEWARSRCARVRATAAR